MSADHTDSLEVTTRMKSSTAKLHQLSARVGMAKQVRDFMNDLRKNALSCEVVKALKAGESATAAEHIGRASPEYAAKLEQLGKSLEEAERIIAEWTAEQASFEAARSLLSFEKATMRDL